MALELLRPGGITPFDDVVELHAPTVLDYEVQSGIRRYLRLGMIDAVDAADTLRAFNEMTFHRHPADRLFSRMWDMRDNISSYDASYVALAEALSVPLVTADKRLARAADIYCEIVTV